MGLVADGDNRLFIYEQPRAGMYNVGVRQGTVLFEGTRDGYQYSGIAYVFPPGCEAIPYEVGGNVSSNDLQVTLYGVRC
jgi:hypothetical protein